MRLTSVDTSAPQVLLSGMRQACLAAAASSPARRGGAAWRPVPTAQTQPKCQWRGASPSPSPGPPGPLWLSVGPWAETAESGPGSQNRMWPKSLENFCLCRVLSKLDASSRTMSFVGEGVQSGRGSLRAAGSLAPLWVSSALC